MEHYPKRERVFWHEIGHFTAHHYNRKYYGKNGVKEVYLKKVDYFGETEYTGHTTPIPPSNYKITDPITHPASFAASLSYGCIFQSIFQNVGFKQCFNYEQKDVHGFHDFNSVAKLKERFSLSKEESEKLDQCIILQFDIVKKSNQLDTLLAMPVNDFIEQDGQRIDIDINKLNDWLSPFLAIHGDVYREYVEKLEDVFGGHQDSGLFRP